MTGRTSNRLVVLGALGVLLLAACGDDQQANEPAAIEPTALSQQAFIEAGDAICGDANERLDALAPTAFDGADLPGAADAWEQIALIDREKITALRALSVPPGDARVEEMLDAFEAAMANVEPVVVAARAGDSAAFETALAQHLEGFAAVGEELAAYGFQLCG